MCDETSKLKYLSVPWLKEVVNLIKSNLTVDDMKKVTTTMMNVYQNCPDGKNHYLYFKFEDGSLEEALVGTDEDDVSTKSAEFQVSGDYETFVLVAEEKIGGKNAIITNRLKLEGNKIKALQLYSVVSKLNKVISLVPTEY